MRFWKQTPDPYNALICRFDDHALAYGFDHARGGVYRDGLHRGPALVCDKEWWQNCEALVGFLDTCERTGDGKYFDAFWKTWQFDRAYFIEPRSGEWRQLLTQVGVPIAADLGNPWKAICRTGRAMLECRRRLTRLLGQ